MSRGSGVIIAGAAETDQVGRLPGYSALGLHVEAAVNAVRDSGLRLRDIFLGLTPADLHLRRARALLPCLHCRTISTISLGLIGS